MDTALEIAKIAIPTLATFVGAYFAYAVRRRMKQAVEERRLDAYLGLWPVLRVAAATRLEGEWAGGPLTEHERSDLFKATTNWYYGKEENGKGYGPFLTARARKVYFKAKKNLICPIDKIEPKENREWVKQSRDVEAARGEMSIRHFSMVRWVMRFDIRLHTEPYSQELKELEIDFLDSCKIDWRGRPFRKWGKVSQS